MQLGLGVFSVRAKLSMYLQISILLQTYPLCPRAALQSDAVCGSKGGDCYRHHQSILALPGPGYVSNNEDHWGSFSFFT